MSKINFTMPVIPQGATAEEKRTIMYNALSEMSVSDYLEQRDNLSYLPWANCFDLLKSIYPSATYKVIKNAEGLPYFADPDTGIMVFTEVSIDGITSECFLPCMDYKNKAMKLTPYTYQAWDSYKKAYVEKQVAAATMFDINKTIWRCLVKNVAIATGIGIGVFQGEDVPEKADDADSSSNRQQYQKQNYNRPAPTMKPADPYAGIKNAIGQAIDVPSLMSLYLDHQGEIEGNPQIKSLLTQRKLQLQQAA